MVAVTSSGMKAEPLSVSLGPTSQIDGGVAREGSICQVIVALSGVLRGAIHGIGVYAARPFSICR